MADRMKVAIEERRKTGSILSAPPRSSGSFRYLAARYRALCALKSILITAAALAVASAHSIYQSDIKIDFTGETVQAELQVPLERIGAVFGKPIDPQTLNANRSSLTAYLLNRFHARTADGRAFKTALESPLTIVTADGARYLEARVILSPPEQANTEVLSIEDDVVLDNMPSQVALVSIRSDWSSGVFANDPLLVGVLRSHSRSLTIERADRHWLRGFTGIFRLGIRHIAEGSDHLLFLLALLLPAPLGVFGSRWTGFNGVRHSLRQIVKVVTAFTIGHSVTLALGALGLVHVPSRPIEVLIAVSILISAVHAMRPLFPGREAVIAACFGLVHGLAFATTLGELGLGRWERVAGIVAFNLGIETMQLVVVALTMPSLILLSRTRVYAAVRIGGASFAVLAATGWIAQQLLEVSTPVDGIADGVTGHAVWIAAGLFAISLVCQPLRAGKTAAVKATSRY